MSSITQKIKAAAADLARAHAAEEAIARAIAAVPRTSHTSGVDVVAMRAALEGAAADVALASFGDGDLLQARARLQEAEAAQAQADEIARNHSATMAGLQRKLDAAQLEVHRMTNIHHAAQGECILEWLKEADAEYAGMAARITRTMGRIKACRALLIDLGFPALPGRGDLVDFLAMGPVSAGIASEKFHAQGGGWGGRFLPQYDQLAEVQLLKREIETLTKPEKGAVARVFSSLSRSVS